MTRSPDRGPGEAGTPVPPEPSRLAIDLGPLLEEVRGLTWASRRRATGVLPGTHRSRLRGTSPELSEYRLYRQGDDPRQLDWKLLARSDRAYVRLAEDRAILPTWFVVDASRSMAFPLDTQAKWRQAVALSVALASLAVAAGDPVGLLVPHSSGMLRLPARTRRGTVQEVAAALARLSPSGSGLMAPALSELHPGARVVLLSDFLGDEPESRRIAAALVAGGSDVHAVHIVADLELDPPRHAARAVDPEDARLARPFDAESYDAYRERFAAWREEVARAWRLAGVAWSMVTTSDIAVRAVRQVIGARHAVATAAT